jgi:hypothetical protein
MQEQAPESSGLMVCGPDSGLRLLQAVIAERSTTLVPSVPAPEGLPVATDGLVVESRKAR